MVAKFYTSESVSAGHPDKMADQISDGILDTCLAQDPTSRVACETLISGNKVVVAGEITTSLRVEDWISGIVHDVATEAGYIHPSYGFDISDCEIALLLRRQSLDIEAAISRPDGQVGAGDQGIMFGYATKETPELMPLPISLAHKLVQRQALLFKNGVLLWLWPDCKAQVTIRYEQQQPIAVEHVVLSTQHAPRVGNETIRVEVMEQIIRPVIPEELLSSNAQFLINPSGQFVNGGPLADTGMTGRKSIVDTYGGACPHGGGCFSGKDPTKVDRSGAYMARYIAKNIVAAGLADSCTVQLAYAIGISEPVCFSIDLHGSGQVNEDSLTLFAREIFPLTPTGIIEELKLLRPIYRKTAVFGHFGRALPEFS